MEEWAEEKEIHPYILATDQKNRKKHLANNSTVEMMRVRKPIPRYIKLVKGNRKIKNRGNLYRDFNNLPEELQDKIRDFPLMIHYVEILCRMSRRILYRHKRYKH